MTAAEPAADEMRNEALARFSRTLGIPDITAIRQRGRDPVTARFTLHFADGETVRVGTVKILWSQAELAKVLFTTLGRVPQRVKPADWQDLLAVLALTCIDVEEVKGEAFEDSVSEWLTEYLDGAAVNTDKAGASARGLPFREDGETYVSAQHFRKYVVREHSEQVGLQDLRQALADIGFTRKTVYYDRGDKRTSKSYYVASDDVLVADDGAPPEDGAGS